MVLIGDFYSNYHSHLVYFTVLQVKVKETDWWRSSRVTLAITQYHTSNFNAFVNKNSNILKLTPGLASWAFDNIVSGILLTWQDSPTLNRWSHEREMAMATWGVLSPDEKESILPRHKGFSRIGVHTEICLEKYILLSL